MAILRAGDILGVCPKIEKVSVPEWGGEVCIRELLVDQREWFESWQLAGGDSPERFRGIRARIAAFCLCDETGQRLFADDDWQKLGNLPARGLDKVFEAILSQNGLSGSSLKELEKN